MKCSIAREDFLPAHAALLPPPIGDETEDKFRAMEMEGYLRAEASGGLLRMRCAYGQAEVPAQVEEPGVVFMEAREFAGATGNALEYPEDPRIEIRASQRRMSVNGLAFLLGERNFAIFDDPAIAPQAWEPAPPPIDEDFDDGEGAGASAESLQDSPA